jgi:hypothetical protein
MTTIKDFPACKLDLTVGKGTSNLVTVVESLK